MSSPRRRYFWPSIAGAIGVAIVSIFMVVTFNNSPNVKPVTEAIPAKFSEATDVFQVDSAPYGIPYKNWTAKWWQWFTSIPLKDSPANDPTGEKCGLNQDDSNVWYMAGTFGGDNERTCAIPSGKAIIGLVQGAECSYPEDKSLKTPEDLKRCAIGSNDRFKVHATIDGVEVKNLQDSKVTSDVFPYDIPEHSVWNLEGGPYHTQSVADGWYLFIKPLEPGKHEFKWGAVKPDISPTSPPIFAYEVTYHLTIK